MNTVPRERVLAELRAIAAPPRMDFETPLGQPDDVILLLQPLHFGSQAKTLTEILDQLAEKNFLTGATCLGPHGVAGALIPRACATGLGFHLDLTENEGANVLEALLSEPSLGTRALVTTRPKAHLPLSNFVDRRGLFTAEAIGRLTRGELRIRWMGQTVLELSSCAPLL